MDWRKDRRFTEVMHLAVKTGERLQKDKPGVPMGSSKKAGAIGSAGEGPNESPE